MKKIVLSIFLLLLFPISIQAKDVILGGDSIGIQLKLDGILITQTYTVQHDTGQFNPASFDILKGDRIKRVNGQDVASIYDFMQILQESKESIAQLEINREGNLLNRDFQIHRVNGQIKTGLFLKDEALGIGTLTFIDPQTHQFASIGHEVMDENTKQLLMIKEGTLYSSQVLNIRKALLQQAGEKEAKIDFEEPLGNVVENTPFGIYGTMVHLFQAPLIEIANQEAIQLGEATMFTVLEDETIEALSIEITRKYEQNQPQIKSFEFIVTDRKCLQLANGIVQGMSGSPVVQNGKLIGAVTHVSSRQPKMGYGVYIEWMIEEIENDFNRQ